MYGDGGGGVIGVGPKALGVTGGRILLSCRLNIVLFFFFFFKFVQLSCLVAAIVTAVRARVAARFCLGIAST